MIRHQIQGCYRILYIVQSTECMLYHMYGVLLRTSLPLLRNSSFVPPLYRQHSFHVALCMYGIGCFRQFWLWQGIPLVQIGCRSWQSVPTKTHPIEVWRSTHTTATLPLLSQVTSHIADITLFLGACLDFFHDAVRMLSSLVSIHMQPGYGYYTSAMMQVVALDRRYPLLCIHKLHLK